MSPCHKSDRQLRVCLFQRSGARGELGTARGSPQDPGPWPGRRGLAGCLCSQDRNSLGGEPRSPRQFRQARLAVPLTRPLSAAVGLAGRAALCLASCEQRRLCLPRRQDGRLPGKSSPGDSTHSAAGPLGLHGAGPPVPSSCCLGAHLGLFPLLPLCVCVCACAHACVCTASGKGGSPLVGDPSQSQTVALPCKSEQPRRRRADG